MILCCGEALIDMLPGRSESGDDTFVPHPGGAVFNTAIALGRLGGATGMLTGLSSDPFGAQLATALADSHVDKTHVIRSDRPTTLAFVTLSGGDAQYAFFDENSAGRMITPDDLPTLSNEVSALFFGGISLASEPGADAYAHLCDRESATRTVMIDPNIRRDFIGDEARYRARLAAMLARADIVKLSDEDIDWWLPDVRPLKDKAQELCQNGAALVIITQGARGAQGFLPDGTAESMPSWRNKVVDTVGAGDAFNAGVLASLAKRGWLDKRRIRALTDDAVSEALGLGARVAGINVSRAGANPPWAHELPAAALGMATGTGYPG